MDNIRFEDLNCSAGQFMTVENKKMVCVDVLQPIIIKEVTMWTIGNIVIVAIIAAVVFKMMPKLTLRNFFRAVWSLIIRPFQRKKKDIKFEWDTAKEDTK
jgi:hypothetical protein